MITVVNVLVDSLFSAMIDRVGEREKELLTLYSWLTLILYDPDMVPDEEKVKAVSQTCRVLRQ